MKKFFPSLPLLLLFIFLWCGCTKEDRTISVVYTVSRTSSAAGKFTVSYSTDGGITKSESLSNEEWASARYKKMSGEFVSMKVQSLSSQVTFIARIYKDGQLFGEAPVDFASGEVEISGVVQQ